MVSRKLLLPALLAPAALAAQTTLYTANFGVGEFNPAAYDVGLDWTAASTKDARGSSMGAGGLALNIASTSSGLAEAQGRVLSSAYALAAAGDEIHLTVTFVNTSNLMAGGNSSVVVGLYNSNGANPYTGLINSKLNATDTDFATGGVRGWQGYALRFLNTGSSLIYTRAAQTDTVNENQDLLFSDVGNGAYDSPAGTTLGTTGTTGLALTTGGTYTIDLGITLGAGGNQTLLARLFTGADTSGALLASITGNIASPVTGAFDAVAFGFRDADTVTALANTMTVTGLNLTATSAIPEPSTYAALLGAATLGLVGWRRRRARREARAD